MKHVVGLFQQHQERTVLSVVPGEISSAFSTNDCDNPMVVTVVQVQRYRMRACYILRVTPNVFLVMVVNYFIEQYFHELSEQNSG